ncbi:MAG: hypothetical protein WB782_01415 [Thermoplasmata archaeon]
MTFRYRHGLLAILAVAFVAMPVASVAQAAAPLAPTNPVAGSGPPGFFGQVTWNGVNVASASSTSSPLGIQFSNTAHLYYNWSSTTTLYNINRARLQFFYFGVSIATRVVTLQVSTPGLFGAFELNWTPGSIQYAVEGLFRLTAGLVAPNGSTIWSENIFVHATAPLGLLAAFPLVLLAIAIYEIYELAYVGREATRGRMGKEPPSSPASEDDDVQPVDSPETPPDRPSSSPLEGAP